MHVIKLHVSEDWEIGLGWKFTTVYLSNPIHSVYSTLFVNFASFRNFSIFQFRWLEFWPYPLMALEKVLTVILYFKLDFRCIQYNGTLKLTSQSSFYDCEYRLGCSIVITNYINDLPWLYFFLFSFMNAVFLPSPAERLFCSAPGFWGPGGKIGSVCNSTKTTDIPSIQYNENILNFNANFKTSSLTIVLGLQ